MVQGDTRKQVDPSTDDDEAEAEPKRTTVLGELKTDAEAQLAREIEQLRAAPRKGDSQ